MKTLVLIQGLPGSGKTTLADLLASVLPKSARLNADQVRATVSRDLKFSITDRKLQAYRLGAMASIALATPISVIGGADSLDHYNQTVIVDFVNPTEETRSVFNWAFRSTNPGGPTRIVSIWMNTIKADDSRFDDTRKLYVPPANFDLEVNHWSTNDQLQKIVDQVVVRFFSPVSYV